MTSRAIKIVGVELVNAPTIDGKSQHLANFTCEVSGIVRLSGCALLRFNTGQIRAFPPTTEKRRVKESPVRILDESIRGELTDAAHRAFLALGGGE